MSAPTPPRLQRKTTIAKQRKSAARGRRLPNDVEVALKARAGGRCELCGEAMPSDRCHRHHRKLRSQGGLDELPNLVLVHPNCHNTIHNHDTWSRQNGFIVDAAKNPAVVPVVMRTGADTTVRRRLTRDGGYRDVA